MLAANGSRQSKESLGSRSPRSLTFSVYVSGP